MFALGARSETEQVTGAGGGHKRQHESRAWVGRHWGRDGRGAGLRRERPSGNDRKNAYTENAQSEIVPEGGISAADISTVD
jgi:hypothetical protein